jgi:hypothetical protein
MYMGRPQAQRKRNWKAGYKLETTQPIIVQTFKWPSSLHRCIEEDSYKILFDIFEHFYKFIAFFKFACVSSI